MSDSKPIAYVSCDFTNREAVVLADVNGKVMTGAEAEDFNVIGFHHSGGHSECEDWMHWNKELVEQLQTTVISTLDLAVSPREAVVVPEVQSVDLTPSDSDDGEDSPLGGDSPETDEGSDEESLESDDELLTTDEEE